MPWPFLKKNRGEVDEGDKRKGWEELGEGKGEGERGREGEREQGKEGMLWSDSETLIKKLKIIK